MTGTARLHVRRGLLLAWAAPHVLLGLAWVLSGPARSSAAAFAELRVIGAPFDHADPIRPWGWAMLALATLLLVAAARGSQLLAQAALAMCTGASAFLAVCFAVAAMSDGASSWTGTSMALGWVVFYGFSLTSVVHRE